MRAATDSSYSSAGSTIANLKVAGIPVADIKPNTKIGLDPILFGLGAYVAIQEEVGSTSGPSAGQGSGGKYASDLKVNAIRVHVEDTNPLKAGSQVIDVIVSQAVAHSDFPQTQLCKTSRCGRSADTPSSRARRPTRRSVGDGGLRVDPDQRRQRSAGALPSAVPADGSLLSTGVTDSKSTGNLGATSSTASSYAQAANVCLLRAGTACTIRATALNSQSNSTANGTSASSNDGGTQLLGPGGGRAIGAGQRAAEHDHRATGHRIRGDQRADLRQRVEANHACSGTTTAD